MNKKTWFIGSLICVICSIMLGYHLKDTESHLLLLIFKLQILNLQFVQTAAVQSMTSENNSINYILMVVTAHMMPSKLR